MLKLNFILLFCIILIIASYSFFGGEHKNKDNRKEVSVKANNFKLLNEKHEKDEATPSLHQTNFTIFDEEQKALETHIKNKVKEESKEQSLKKTPFKSADEVIQKLFPKIELELGPEMFKHLKSNFPTPYLARVLTLEQKIEYRRIKGKKREDVLIIDGMYDSVLDIEEARIKRGELALIREFYLPKLINLLTEDQQKQMIEDMSHDYFDWYRERRAKGQPVVEDSLDNMEKIMKNPKLLKILQERQKEFEGK